MAAHSTVKLDDAVASVASGVRHVWREGLIISLSSSRLSTSVDPRLHRLRALDGWRGISILLVLAGHMLPIGPKWLHLNVMVAAAGLSIFFCLSGFLIVSMLLRNSSVLAFFVRRFFRILPLAWLVLLAMLIVVQPAAGVWSSNLFFYSNLVPHALLPYGKQLWSLSVEMQFYLFAGVAVAAFGTGSLLLLVPAACVAITLARAIYGMEFSIVTWFCVDEILAGGMLALFVNLSSFARVGQKWPPTVTLVLMAALFLTCHEQLGPANYFRAYVAALLVYSTIYPREGWLQTALSSAPLSYCAKLSYALYVIHPLTCAGWLGEGDVVTRYSKRLLSFTLAFLAAHISSTYYEKYWNDFGHRLASYIERKKAKQDSHLINRNTQSVSWKS
ncbi:MAG TPA: acyltransferase [Candidatus Acidoferrales bacterium]|nr:acyltransferase [Candidatus Acidoferrales bacterium]